MSRSAIGTSFAVVALTATALVGSARSASAVDQEFTLPAGTGCQFALHVEAVGGNQQVRPFLDGKGNPVTLIEAGTGTQVTVTNVSNEKELRFRSNGVVTRTVFHEDGTRTVTTTGHLILILFPTDKPAGPSTTLIVGRVVYDSTPNDDFTVQSITGRTTDLCALLT